MKKVILLILSLAVVTSTFSACGDTPATESSSESATNKVVAITTTTFEKKSETSSVATETENVVETTPAVSETQSKTETNPEPVSEKKLNLDLLLDIGLTYEEISAKRGERIDVYEGEGGFGYIFENGYGEYGWGFEDLDWGREIQNGEGWPIPRDESGSLIKNLAPLPKTQVKCEIIKNMKSKDLFLGLDHSVSVSEIEKIYGIKHVSTSDGCMDSNYNYSLAFTFNDINIAIYTKERDKIDLDSYLFLKTEL